VRCVEDAALVQRLARERMPLTVCPLSNVKLCVFKTMAEHNLAVLLDAGLCATVNSDDPAYFGAYITDNYLALAQAAALGAADVALLARNAFTIAWLSTTRRDQYLDQLDAYAAAHGVAG